MTDILKRISFVLPAAEGEIASVLQVARDEIARLRAEVILVKSIAGGSFREIKQEIKNGPSV